MQPKIDELLDRIAKRIVDAILPEAFLVKFEDMHMLMHICTYLEKDHPVTPQVRAEMITAMSDLIEHSQPLTKDNIATLIAALDLAASVDEAKGKTKQ